MNNNAQDLTGKASSSAQASVLALHDAIKTAQTAEAKSTFITAAKTIRKLADQAIQTPTA